MFSFALASWRVFQFQFADFIDGEERLQDEKGMLGLRLGNKQKARLFTASLKSQVFCVCGGNLMVP